MLRRSQIADYSTNSYAVSLKPNYSIQGHDTTCNLCAMQIWVFQFACQKGPKSAKRLQQVLKQVSAEMLRRNRFNLNWADKSDGDKSAEMW